MLSVHDRIFQTRFANYELDLLQVARSEFGGRACDPNTMAAWRACSASSRLLSSHHAQHTQIFRARTQSVLPAKHLFRPRGKTSDLQQVYLRIARDERNLRIEECFQRVNTYFPKYKQLKKQKICKFPLPLYDDGRITCENRHKGNPTHLCNNGALLYELSYDGRCEQDNCQFLFFHMWNGKRNEKLKDNLSLRSSIILQYVYSQFF